MKLLAHLCIGWFLVVLFGTSLRAQEESETQELILPIVVNGIVEQPKHFQATFSFLNFSNSTVHGALAIYDDKGTLRTDFLECEPVTRPPDVMELTLLPDGLFHHTGIAATDLLAGWGHFTWEGSARLEGSVEVTLIEADPTPCLVICNRSSTEVITSVQVEGVRPAKGFRAPAIITPNRHSAFAIVNPSETDTATVDLTVFDGEGQPLDENRFQIPPQSRLGKFLWELMILGKTFIVPPVPPERLHGSIRITSDMPVAVGGIYVLLPEGKFVNLPVDSLEE